MQATSERATTPADRQERARAEMNQQRGSNGGVPAHYVQEQTIEESFAAGDIRTACDHVWILTRQYVADRVPANNPLHTELVNRIGASITAGMSQRNLNKIRNPSAYILHAVRLNFIKFTQTK